MATGQPPLPPLALDRGTVATPQIETQRFVWGVAVPRARLDLEYYEAVPLP